MIDLKELRIGNYLNIDGLDSPIGPGWFCAADRMHTLPKHEPIPITEEWLQRFGIFRGKSYPETFIMPGDFPDYEFMEGKFMPAETYYHFFMPEIKYVHQLQNLYFAITRKELEIKETA